MNAPPKKPSADALRTIVEAHLPTEERTPIQTREDALTLFQAESRMSMMGVWGGAADRKALEKIDKALKTVAKQSEVLSSQVRSILERELSRATYGTWRPRFYGRTLVALKRARHSESLGDNPAQKGWRAMAIVDACEDVWRIRTGEDPPSIVDGHTDRPSGSFRSFAESVFQAFGEKQLVSTAQLRLREFEGTRSEFTKSSDKKSR